MHAKNGCTALVAVSVSAFVGSYARKRLVIATTQKDLEVIEETVIFICGIVNIYFGPSP